MTTRVNKVDTIAGFTIAQVATVCDYPPTERWIFRGSHRRRRMRILLSCVWYHEMIPDQWYTTEELKGMCLEHDSRGSSSMIISNQRIGTLFRVLIAREMVEMRTVKGRREYKKGELNEN